MAEIPASWNASPAPSKSSILASQWLWVNYLICYADPNNLKKAPFECLIVDISCQGCTVQLYIKPYKEVCKQYAHFSDCEVSYWGEVNFPKVAIKSVHLWLSGKVPPLTSSFSTKFREYLVAAFRLKQLDKTISRLNYWYHQMVQVYAILVLILGYGIASLTPFIISFLMTRQFLWFLQSLFPHYFYYECSLVIVVSCHSISNKSGRLVSFP